MSIYPGAVVRTVAYTGLHLRSGSKAMLLHTNGGGAQLKGWWDSKAAQGSHIGAQYQVFWDGKVECYVDPKWVIYHAYGASEWAFGVETQDDGDPSKPWTPAMITSIAKIGVFHDVPAKLLAGSSAADGVGYHQEFDAWNQSGHNCPGSVRCAQIPTVLKTMATLLGTPAPAPVPAPVSVPAFPLPAGSYFGPKDGPAESISGYYSHNADLKKWQVQAAKKGYALTADGFYGTQTAAVAKALQKRYGYAQDGLIGPYTWATPWKA